MIICPFRLLERRQIFHDCIHLLKLHEPGNELRGTDNLTCPVAHTLAGALRAHVYPGPKLDAFHLEL